MVPTTRSSDKTPSYNKLAPDERGRLNFKRRFALRLLLSVTSVIFAFSVVILMGAAVQDHRASKRPSTESYYQGAQVCGSTHADNFAAFQSAFEAHEKNALVVHCGDCGDCSTSGDISIYKKTRNSLTGTATSCATKVFTGGRSAVHSCFETDVGFTAECNDCWTDNVMCDLVNCAFTCTKSLFLGQQNNKGDTSLNACLFCDERMCGPQFIECAGANRRRCGIVSDIERNGAVEVCATVD